MSHDHVSAFTPPSIPDYRPSVFTSRKVLPRRDVIDGRLPRGKVVLLAGEGGVGKSMVLMHLFAAITHGHTEFFGGQVVGGSQCCVLVLAEDDEDTVALRLQNITTGSLPDIGFVLPLPNIGPQRIIERDSFYETNLRPTEFLKWLDESLAREAALNGKLGFLGLDPFAALLGVDENKASEVQFVWSHLTTLAVKHDICIVVTHHLRKDTQQGRSSIRGSSALVDGVRAAYVVTKEENPGEILTQLEMPTDTGLGVINVSLVKDNLGLRLGRITLIRNLDGTLTDVTSQLQAWMTAEEAMIKVIREANAAGRRLTKTGKSGIYSSRADGWPQVLKQMKRDPMEMKVQEMINKGLLRLGENSSLIAMGLQE